MAAEQLHGRPLTATGRPNFRNRTVWTGDNLDILRGINSESVELIYLDPPFNSNKTYSAPIGSKAAGAAFTDTWTLDDVDEAWHGEIADRDPGLYAIIGGAGIAHGASMKSYLIMMAVRLLEMRRVLKPGGSLYLHCDPTANAYLRMLMDAIFGAPQFKNEIVWRRTSSYEYKGYLPEWGWRKVREKVEALDEAGRLVWSDSGRPYVKRYLSEHPGTPIRDVVTDIPPVSGHAKERTGYPTQKPLALLERIIAASSNPGDMVLDPFCGCATALVAAETQHRRWAGIDLSPLAVKLVGQRLQNHHGMFGQIVARDDVPKRDDLGKLPNYRTHRHTLYGRQEGICNGCLVHFPFRNLTVDHVVPQSKGGSDHESNLQLLCGACNSKKGKRSMAALVAELLAAGIRNGDTYRSMRR